MSNPVIETIKEKLDLVEFLKGYLALHPAGKNLKALCPFHREKTPSFMVSPERQTWHCFGCNTGGDIFTFLMQQEHVEFGDALKVLAERAGVELKRLNPAEYKFAGLLYELHEAAKSFFVRERERSPEALRYLKERGLEPQTIEEFELGWAPNAPEALTLHLLNLGYAPDDIVRSGLTIKTEKGRTFDRFRGRIMFPLANQLGKVVGFTGRILPSLDTGEMGKYVNSPESPIFNKSKLLYGFDKCKNFIREAGKALLVEGQMDCVMSAQAGVRNVVATSGTALTPDHLRLLARVTDELVVSFDNDDAGWQAGERAIELAQAADFSVKVVLMKAHKDAADAAQENPEKFRTEVMNARPAPEFYFEKYLPQGTVDLRERDGLKRLRAVLGKIKQIPSALTQSVWLKELAKRSGADLRALEREAEMIEASAPPLGGGPKNEEDGTKKEKFSRRELISQRLLSIFLSRGELPLLEAHVSYFAPPYKRIYQALCLSQRSTGDLELDQLMNLVVLRSEELAEGEIEDLKKYLLYEYVRERRAELKERVREAEAVGDETRLHTALREFEELPAL